MAGKESDFLVGKKVTVEPKHDGVDVDVHKIVIDVGVTDIESIIKNIGSRTSAALKDAITEISKVVEEAKKLGPNITMPVKGFTKASIDTSTGKYHYDTVKDGAYAFNVLKSNGMKQVLAAVKNEEGSFEVYDIVAGIKVIDGFFKDVRSAITATTEALGKKERYPVERRALVGRIGAMQDAIASEAIVIERRRKKIAKNKEESVERDSKEAEAKSSKEARKHGRSSGVTTLSAEEAKAIVDEKKKEEESAERIKNRILSKEEEIKAQERAAKLAEERAKSSVDAANKEEELTKKQAEANAEQAEANKARVESVQKAADSSKSVAESAEKVAESSKDAAETARVQTTRATSAKSGGGMLVDVSLKASNLDELFNQVQSYFDDHPIDVKFGKGIATTVSKAVEEHIERSNEISGLPAVISGTSKHEEYLDALYSYRPKYESNIPWSNFASNVNIQQTVDAVSSWIGSGLSQIFDVADEVLAAQEANKQKNIEQVKAAVVSGASDITRAVAGKSAEESWIAEAEQARAAELAMEGSEGVGAKFSDMAEDIVESIGGNIPDELVDRAAEAFVSKFKKIIEKATKYLDDSDASELRKMARPITVKNQDVRNALKDSDIETLSMTRLDDIESFIRDFGSDKLADLVVSSITKQFEAAATSLQSAAKDIGKNVDAGLAEGIKSGSEEASEASKEMATNVEEAAKKTLEVHSPSRKFIEIGKMVVEGLRQGLATMPEEIDKVIKDLESHLKAAETQMNNTALSDSSRASAAKRAQTIKDNLLLMKSIKYVNDAYEHVDGAFVFGRGVTASTLDKEANRIEKYATYLNGEEPHVRYDEYIAAFERLELAKKDAASTPVVSDEEKQKILDNTKKVEENTEAVKANKKEKSNIAESSTLIGIPKKRDTRLIDLKAGLESYYIERNKVVGGKSDDETLENLSRIRDAIRDILKLSLSDEEFDRDFLNPDKAREYVSQLKHVNATKQDTNRLDNIIAEGTEKVRRNVARVREEQEKHKDTVDKTSKSTYDLARAQQSVYSLITGSMQRITSLFTGIIGGLSLNTVIQNVQTLDKAVVNLQVATGFTREETQGLVESYSDFAHEMGATTSEIANAADGWLRQGYALEKTNDLIRASIELSKLGKISSEEAQKAITATIKGYQMEAEEAESVVDKLTSVDMAAAIDAGEIAAGLSRVATMSKTLGIDLDNLVGYIAQVGQTMQVTGDVAGTGLKSIFGRMAQIKTGKIGEAIIDPETAEDISNVDTTLSLLGVHLRDQKGNFRDFDDVLKETAKLWDELGRKGDTTRQAAIANALGGTRMRPYVDALLNGYAEAMHLAEVSANSTGNAAKKYEAYSESVEAAINRVKSAYENLSQTILSSDLLATLFEGMSNVVSGIDLITERIGGLSTVLYAFAASGALKIASTVFSGALFRGAGLSGALSALSGIAPVLTTFAGAVAGLATVVGLIHIIKEAYDGLFDWESHAQKAEEAKKQEKSLESQLDTVTQKIADLQEEGSKNGFSLEINNQIALLKQEQRELDENIKKLRELNDEETKKAKKAADRNVERQFDDAMRAYGVDNSSFFLASAEEAKEHKRIVDSVHQYDRLNISHREDGTSLLDIITGNAEIDYGNIQETRELVNALINIIDKDAAADLYVNFGNASASSKFALENAMDIYRYNARMMPDESKISALYESILSIMESEEYKLLEPDSWSKKRIDEVLNSWLFDAVRKKLEATEVSDNDNGGKTPSAAIKTYSWRKTLTGSVKATDEIKQEDALAGVIKVLEAEVASVNGIDDVMVGKINPNLADHVAIIAKNDDALQRYIKDWQDGVITSDKFLEVLKNAQEYSLYGTGSTSWDRVTGELESYEKQLEKVDAAQERFDNNRYHSYEQWQNDVDKLDKKINTLVERRDALSGTIVYLRNLLVSEGKTPGEDAQFNNLVNKWLEYNSSIDAAEEELANLIENRFSTSIEEDAAALAKQRKELELSDGTVKALIEKYPALTQDIIAYNNAVKAGSNAQAEYNKLISDMKILADQNVASEINSQLSSFMGINDQGSFAAWMLNMENTLATTGKWKTDDITAFMQVFKDMQGDLSRTSKQDALTKLKDLAKERPDWEPWIKFFDTLFEFEKNHTQYETAFKAIQDFFNSSTPGEKQNAIEQLNDELEQLSVDGDTRDDIYDLLNAATTPEQKQSALAQMLDILTKLGRTDLTDLITQTKEFMSLNDPASMERSGARNVESALSSYLNNTRNVLDREDVVVNLKKALLESHQFGETMDEINKLFEDGGMFYNLANSTDFSAASKLNVIQDIINAFAANANTTDWAPVFENMIVSFDAEAQKRSGANNIAGALSTFLGAKDVDQAREVSKSIMQSLVNDFEFTRGQAEGIINQIFAGLIHEGSYNRESNAAVLESILGAMFTGNTPFSASRYIFDDLFKDIADPTVWQNYTSPLQSFFDAENDSEKTKAWGEFLDQLKDTENISDDTFGEISKLGTMSLNRNSMIAMLISLLHDDVNSDVIRALQEMRLVETEQSKYDASKKLVEYGLGGNVDLLNRPRIMFSQARDVPVGDWATVSTETFTDENGTIAVNFTPYIVDGNGNYVGYLSADELRTYAEGVISGAHGDYYNLQIGAWFTGEDALARAERVAEDIHLAQEQYYHQISDDSAKLEAYNSAYADRQMYGTASYSTDMMNLFGGIYSGQTTSLSPEQIDMLLQRFPQLNDEIKKFNDGTMSATEFWEQLSLAISHTNFDEGAKSLSDLMDVIKNSTKGTYKYAEAVESISDMFGDFIDEEDIPGYFDEIKDMLNGDQDAFEELQSAMAEGIETKWDLDPGGIMSGLWTVQGLAQVLGVEADKLLEQLIGLGMFTTKPITFSGYAKWLEGKDPSDFGIKEGELGGNLDLLIPTDNNPLRGKHKGGGGGKKNGGGKKSILSEQYTKDKGLYGTMIDSLKNLNNLYEEGSEEWLRNQQRIIETYQAYAKTVKDEYDRLTAAGVSMAEEEMQTLSKDLLKVNKEIYDAAKEYWEAVRDNMKESMEHIVSQMDAVLDLRKAHKDLLTDLRQENRELEKQYKIAQDEAAHPGLTEAEHEMLFSSEDFKRLTGMLQDISKQADALYEEYKNKIASVTEEETYAVEYITEEYERQLGLLESQYEIAKQQLAVEKARQELQNTLRERNTAVLINGAWTWMADPDAVQAAMEKVADAEVELEDAITDSEFNKETAEIETARDAIKSSIDAMEALEFAIEDLAEGIVDLTDSINENIFKAIGTTSRNYLKQTKGHGLELFMDELTELQETSGLVFSNTDVEKLYSLLSSGNTINSSNIFDDSIVHDSAAIASILNNTTNNGGGSSQTIIINGITLSDTDSEMLLNALERVSYTWQA